MKDKWIIQTWYRYKMSRGGFAYEPNSDRKFDNEEEVDKFLSNADYGSSANSDMCYDYRVISPKEKSLTKSAIEIKKVALFEV